MMLQGLRSTASPTLAMDSPHTLSSLPTSLCQAEACKGQA